MRDANASEVCVWVCVCLYVCQRISEGGYQSETGEKEEEQRILFELFENWHFITGEYKIKKLVF